MADGFNYINPSLEEINQFKDMLCWDQLSLMIERDFTSEEIHMFYDKINIGAYLTNHNISDNDFKYLSDRGRISFVDRYRLCIKPGRITDSNIEEICGDFNSLWAQAFIHNDISEETLITNFDTISAYSCDFRNIAAKKLLESSGRYDALLLLLELNK